MTIHLPETLQARIHHLLAEAYPNEGGGFRLGRVDNGGVTVLDIVPVRNVFAEEEQYHRYAMTPADWARLEDEADARGLGLVGYFHSHPDSPAVPSEYDRVHALPNFVYIIVSVAMARAADTRAWRLVETRERFDERCSSIWMRCRATGILSSTARQAQGYARLYNMAGGINAWARKIDPSLPVY